VKVSLADTAAQDTWTKVWEESVVFEPARIKVVLFDTKNGFSLH
jgi:hypothetical protein